ncbi:hypothetical protein ACQP1W_31820 [Spirillospora sp. CA-255316]
MNRPVLLANGRLRVPEAEFDADVGGIAHTHGEIGPDHPAYTQLREIAVPEEGSGNATTDPALAERDSRQTELDCYLRERRGEGDAMLRMLELMTDVSHRRAS